MARQRPDPDDFDDDELPDGVYHDDEPAAVKCPHCGEEVHEDAQYCPRCENNIAADRPASKPIWIWVCLILALLASVVAAFL